jgi:non-muscle caldesmon, putative
MNDKELNKQNRKKWFKKWWGILLIVFCPYLLFLVIFQSNIDKKKKIVFSSILTILIAGVFLGALLEPSPEEKIAIEKQKQEQLKKLEKEKIAKIEEEKKLKEIENKKIEMELEQERKKKILEEEKIRVLEEQKSRETENIKLEQEKNEKESNSELKRICKELLSIISNDKFRPGYEYMLTPQESREIAFANLNIAKNNIHKLKNIKCNLQCVFLDSYKRKFNMFYNSRIDMLEIFLNSTNNSNNNIFRGNDSQIYKQKTDEYHDYEYKIKKDIKSLEIYYQHLDN